MSATTAIFKRELRGYFGTPVAYVFLVAFVFFCTFQAFRDGFYSARDANLRVFFSNLPLLFAVLGPAIAMRMWAEERRSGTIELLLTLPVKIEQAVVGKFLAGWVFFGIGLLLTWGMVFTVAYLGDPDPGPIFSGYLGAFLLAGAYLAVGCFFSVLTKNQVIAFILGTAACLFFVFAGSPSVTTVLASVGLPRGVVEFFEMSSFSTHYDVMQLGLVELRNLVFMAAVAACFLLCSVLMLRENKAS